MKKAIVCMVEKAEGPSRKYWKRLAFSPTTLPFLRIDWPNYELMSDFDGEPSHELQEGGLGSLCCLSLSSLKHGADDLHWRRTRWYAQRLPVPVKMFAFRGDSGSLCPCGSPHPCASWWHAPLRLHGHSVEKLPMTKTRRTGNRNREQQVCLSCLLLDVRMSSASSAFRIDLSQLLMPKHSLPSSSTSTLGRVHLAGASSGGASSGGFSPSSSPPSVFAPSSFATHLLNGGGGADPPPSGSSPLASPKSQQQQRPAVEVYTVVLSEMDGGLHGGQRGEPTKQPWPCHLNVLDRRRTVHELVNTLEVEGLVCAVTLSVREV